MNAKVLLIIIFTAILSHVFPISFYARKALPTPSNLTAVTNTIYIVEAHEETLMDMLEEIER